jgi:hypothetical protein
MALSFELTPFPTAFDELGIVNLINRVSPGVYVLGSPHKDGGVTIGYLGRADKDIADRLTNHELRGRFSHFVFAYADSADEAYRMECEMYHLWQTAVPSQIHPARPKGSYPACPSCRA